MAAAKKAAAKKTVVASAPPTGTAPTKTRKARPVKAFAFGLVDDIGDVGKLTGPFDTEAAMLEAVSLDANKGQIVVLFKEAKRGPFSTKAKIG